MEKLLFYRWGSLSEKMFAKGLERCSINYIEFNRKCQDYHADAEFGMELINAIHAEGCDGVFSFDYFPMISMICQMNNIPYYAWIYDCPMLTLMSGTVTNSCNHILCFDALQAEKLQNIGAVGAVHFPLWADEWILDNALSLNGANESKFRHDISFIGNLYNEDKNRIRNAIKTHKFSPYTEGYIDAVVNAQLNIYGYNFINEVIPEAIVSEIVEVCGLSLGDKYIQDPLGLVKDAIGMEVSSRERIKLLGLISSAYDVDLYTGSDVPNSIKAQVHGYADNETELPLIYKNSKINLNMTSKTIESGIPLRVMDILSCGGFCLTNYQPEIAQFFNDGEDLVMYYDANDLMSKIDYYLNPMHEEERTMIASRGQAKAIENWEMDARIKEMISL